MTFAKHIKNKIFIPRLKEKRILVVYDEQNRFREICAELESEQCSVIFTNKRPISSRQDAMERWKTMSEDTTFQSQMLIHCMEPAPKDNNERQLNPFASYAAVGTAFPIKASDDYRQLCYSFLKDRTAEIDQLFASGEEPPLELLDNLAGGSYAHPQLEAIFGTPDPSKIIPDFLAPPKSKPEINDKLEKNTHWCDEMRQLLQRTLGLTLNIQSIKAETMRKKLWQYLLFSEFANDLPSELPNPLQDVPKAHGALLVFAKSLCEDLRKHIEKKEIYREQAEKVENDLKLASICEGIKDLGQIDTFAFEEKNFLRHAAIAIKVTKWDLAREILEKHKSSLWAEEGERQLLWEILELGLETLSNIKRAEIHLKNIKNSGKELCQLFDTELINVDRAYRKLEEATAQTLDGYEEIEAIIDVSRKAYRTHFNLLQTKFLTVVKQEGWPLNDIKANISSYDDLIAPALRDGKRIVYLLIDAFRVDLAQDLESAIRNHKVRRIPACAQLPCVTKFGMASLLPDAQTKLRFEKNGSELVPIYDGKDISTRKARLEIFKSILNDRVSTTNLSDFIDTTKTKKLRDSFIKKNSDTDLLVITSIELDSLGEGTNTNNLKHIPTVMKELRTAISRCSELNYDRAVICTDHGFVWIEDADVGSTCDTPLGEWPLKKRRCYLGTGEETIGSQRFSAQELSIPSDTTSFIVPKSLATFSKGNGYFHEGLSLQESIVPQVIIDFAKTGQNKNKASSLEIELSCKQKTIHARIFSINISWPGTPDMFSEGNQLKLVVLQNNQEIGFPTPSDYVDPSSSFVKIKPGESIKVSLRLDDNAEDGTINIKAINPETDVTVHSLSLKFNPTVF